MKSDINEHEHLIECIHDTQLHKCYFWIMHCPPVSMPLDIKVTWLYFLWADGNVKPILWFYSPGEVLVAAGRVTSEDDSQQTRFTLKKKQSSRLIHLVTDTSFFKLY